MHWKKKHQMIIYTDKYIIIHVYKCMYVCMHANIYAIKYIEA